MSHACRGTRAVALAAALCLSAGTSDGTEATGAAKGERARHLTAREVFQYDRMLIFQDDFASGVLDKWNFSENANYGIGAVDDARIKVVAMPGLGHGRKAVRFAVRRAPDSFRSEISLPSEKGFQERWYGERVLVPGDWVFDPNRGGDIVMQWHAIPGNWRATFPNLAISIQNTNWFIAQSYGSAQSKPTRTRVRLDEPVRPGSWVSWVVHAKWAPDAGGLLEIWKDGRAVLNANGPNVYSTIGVEYTPYLKTGIYRPEWHVDREGGRAAFDRETIVATNKVICVTDIKIGGAQAAFEDVAPGPIGGSEQ